MADLEVHDQGSIVLLTPTTDTGREWLTNAVDDEAQWFGPSLAVERRYVEDIVTGAVNDGLEVRF